MRNTLLSSLLVIVVSFGVQADKPNPSVIQAAKGAYIIYTVLTGFYVGSAYYVLSDAPPVIDGISVSYPRSAARSINVESYRTVLDREMSLKYRLETISVTYRNLRETIENAIDEFGIDATISKKSIEDFQKTVQKACEEFSQELLCGPVIYEQLDTMINQAVILKASEGITGEDAKGTFLEGAKTIFAEKGFDPKKGDKCSTDDVVDYYEKLGYSFEIPGEDILFRKFLFDQGKPVPPYKTLRMKKGDISCDMMITVTDGPQIQQSWPSTRGARISMSPTDLQALFAYYEGTYLGALRQMPGHMSMKYSILTGTLSPKAWTPATHGHLSKQVVRQFPIEDCMELTEKDWCQEFYDNANSIDWKQQLTDAINSNPNLQRAMYGQN
ncbi:MAG: hypothetical protein KDD48_04660 [Bdellovibrionales bacterium]|nr:hypothetical protein [Bdellovibrionales bacterium]